MSTKNNTTKMINVLGVIPARMGSSRFPGKPIKLIHGKPMLWHVWQRSRLSPALDDLVIATCDKEIKKVSESFGAKVVMTSSKHKSAQNRVAEVADKVPCKIIFNIQGDEPLLHPQLITNVVRFMMKNPKIQGVCPVSIIQTEEERCSAHTMKVVFDLSGKIVYFSRCPIPSDAIKKRTTPVYRQVPIMAFRREFCRKLVRLKPGPLEQQEGADLLRAVEYNLPIHILKTKYETIGVDNPSDIAIIENVLKKDKVYLRYSKK